MTVKVKTTKEKEHIVKFKFDGENTFETLVKKELSKSNKDLKDLAAREFTVWLKECELSATYNHRHYIEDAEYIPFEEDIEPYLIKELDKPIIRWDYAAKEGDKEILGYDFLPNKYFFKYSPPAPSDELINEFWKIEKKTEQILSSIKQLA